MSRQIPTPTPAVPSTAAARRARRLAGAGSVLALGLLPGVATAQTVTSPFGPVTPGYNVVTQDLGTDFDTAALQARLEQIANDPLLPTEAQKRAAIEEAVRNATGGVTGACAEQLDPIVSSLSLASAATGLGGNIAELLGSIFLFPGTLTPGIALNIASSGLSIAEASVSTAQTALPNCDADFTGTIRGYANLATGQGISAHGGAISLGNPDGVTYQRGIAIGGGAVSGAGEGALARTTNPNDVAIGNGAFAGGNAVALGSGAEASATQATAIGTGARATTENALAAGSGASANGGAATALGTRAAAGGEGSVAVGFRAEASGIGSVAVGVNAQASGSASTAIGLNARATARSTTALGEAAIANANNAIAIGGNTLATGSFSTALGQASRATAVSSLAAGQAALAESAGAVALGANAEALAEDSVALGRGAIADQANTVSVGRAGAERRIVNVAAGTAPTDAVNVSQLNAVRDQTQGNTEAIAALDTRVTDNTTRIVALEDGRAGPVRANAAPGAPSASATGTNSLAAGSGAAAAGGNSAAVGTGAAASGTASLAVGNGAAAGGSRSVAIGARARATGSNSVAIGPDSVDEGEDNVVSVGAPGATRRVVNVGTALRDTDAVNLAQLLSTSSQTLQSANIYTDARIAEVRFDLGQLRQDTDAATASAMAIATIPQSIQPGRGMFGIGTATWQGESAVALGISKATPDGDVVVNFRASINTRGDGGAAGGVGFAF